MILEQVTTSEDFLRACKAKIAGGSSYNGIDLGRIKDDFYTQCSACRGECFIGQRFNGGVIGKYNHYEFCPRCDDVETRIYGFEDGGDCLLPLLKSQAIQSSSSGVVCSGWSGPERVAESCPVCKGKTLLFLTESDSTTNPMTYYQCYYCVCVDPNCDWPGSFSSNSVTGT